MSSDDKSVRLNVAQGLWDFACHGGNTDHKDRKNLLYKAAELLREQAQPSSTVATSQVNDPTNWNPSEEFDGLEFTSYTHAKKAEVLFNRLLRERDEAMKYGHEWRLKAALATKAQPSAIEQRKPVVWRTKRVARGEDWIYYEQEPRYPEGPVEPLYTSAQPTETLTIKEVRDWLFKQYHTSKKAADVLDDFEKFLAQRAEVGTPKTFTNDIKVSLLKDKST